MKINKIICRVIHCRNLSSRSFKKQYYTLLKEIRDEAKLRKWKCVKIRGIFYAAHFGDTNELISAKNVEQANSLYEYPLFRIDYFCE